MSDGPSQHGYWRSLAELADTPEFRAQLAPQFPEAGQPYETTEDAGAMARRRWMQLMGASVALAGAAGCRWEAEDIVPFAKRPEGRVPGERQRFATTMDIAGDPLGLLVTCVDGRPIKIEGNPKHPSSLGGTNAFAQAAILELYDPDRSRYIIERTEHGDQIRKWDEFEPWAKQHFASFREKKGKGLAILAEPSSSPTLESLRERLLGSFPDAQWYAHNPAEMYRGRTRASMTPVYHLDKADVIVCLDADLLGIHPQAVRHGRDFACGREPASGKMNRLYVVESALTITGAMADHRLPLRSWDIETFAEHLRQCVEAYSANREPPTRDVPAGVNRFIQAVARDLLDHKGRCVVAIGWSGTIAGELNYILGAYGQTVEEVDARQKSSDDFVRNSREVIDDLTAGRIDTLLILGGNPVYSAPGDVDFAAAVAKAKTSIHLSYYRNETSRKCKWHVPQQHFLESWGDARTPAGVYSVVQPMIDPIYRGTSAIELLALALGIEQMTPREMVRVQFKSLFNPKELDRVWRRTLHDGVFGEQKVQGIHDAGSVETKVQRIEKEEDLNVPLPTDQLKINAWDGKTFEVVFRLDYKVLDGRFANNGWLQEFPDPISRLTWGNAAQMSVETAKKLGVVDGQLLRIKKDKRELTIPACIIPGIADGTLVLPLGYGRTAAGKVGGSYEHDVEPVGVNVNVLRTSKSPWHLTNVTVEPLQEKVALANVQDHFLIDKTGYEARTGRVPELVRQATLEKYKEHPDFAQHAVHVPHRESLWEEYEYQGHRWALTVDLSKCIGCGTCVVACQAENNIPVVGKDRVIRGREMHWLRIDRYFDGKHPENPTVSFEPMACQQCEMAPCEGVCPVNATVHSSEGLNDMVYNRCVGTRYCGNNCPYKVRRFNYFNYHREFNDPVNEIRKMGNNPDVTVRSRGVMEKCTYCVQRIQEAKITARNKRRPLVDGEIVTACQQACPTGAIVFGDLGPQDTPAKTDVARLFADPRSYELLEAFNHKTRTRYLAKIRNPNKALLDNT